MLRNICFYCVWDTGEAPARRVRKDENMDAVMDFFWAALPWLALGAGLALAFAGSAHVRKGETLPLQYAAL